MVVSGLPESFVFFTNVCLRSLSLTLICSHTIVLLLFITPQISKNLSIYDGWSTVALSSQFNMQDSGVPREFSSEVLLLCGVILAAQSKLYWHTFYGARIFVSDFYEFLFLNGGRKEHT